MIRETEVYLEAARGTPVGLARIPSVVVGRARFTARFARDFWTSVLGVPYSITELDDQVLPDPLKRATPGGSPECRPLDLGDRFCEGGFGP